MLGILLAVVYSIAALAQVIVGRLLDRVSVKPFFIVMVCIQIPLLLLVAYAQGWPMYVALVVAMAFIFGSIPFIDVIIVRYVDDRIRSRVAGMRLTVSLGLSSLAVWVLGPFVKTAGFDSLFLFMAAISLCTVATVSLLPSERTTAQWSSKEG
jgi:MFS family permease